MDEKIIKTRIVHKHDTEANWNEVTDFIPKLGEIIVYDVDDKYSYERIKIGDGATLVSNLPFSIEHIENALATHKHNYYGVCSTAAGTAAKTVEIEGFELEVGAIVIIKFDNANSASNPTLNVSGTGAKPMYRYGTTALSTGTTTTGWYADSVQWFVYDGTGWIRDYWNNSTYSNAGLGQGYGTCATAAATVAKTVILSNYALTTGGIVAVRFDNGVPANATMNINSKGAKSIYYRGAAITDNIIKAGDIAVFIYSTQYHLISIDRWQEDIENGANISSLEEYFVLKTDDITDEYIDALCGEGY